MRRLEDIAKVEVGQIMTRVSSKDGEGVAVKVLIPGAVSQGSIKGDALGSALIDESKKLDDRFYTRENDLVMKLTPDYDVAVITNNEEGIVISSLVCVIRVSNVDVHYLCAVLNSDYIKNELKMKSDSAVRAMVKVSDIRKLEIPELDIDQQIKIGEAYRLSNEKLQILNEMTQNETLVMRSIVNNMIKEVIDNE